MHPYAPCILQCVVIEPAWQFLRWYGNMDSERLATRTALRQACGPEKALSICINYGWVRPNMAILLKGMSHSQYDLLERSVSLHMWVGCIEDNWFMVCTSASFMCYALYIYQLLHLPVKQWIPLFSDTCMHIAIIAGLKLPIPPVTS